MSAEPPIIEPLTEDEAAWRDNQLRIAGLLAKLYTGNAEPNPEIRRLDETIAAWLDDGPNRVEVNVLVNALGVSLGQHLADKAHLHWVIATDNNGSDLAVHGQPGDVLIFPANALAKRVVNGERMFVGPLFDQLLGGIEERRRLG